jgi:hypothetical protein
MQYLAEAAMQSLVVVASACSHSTIGTEACEKAANEFYRRTNVAPMIEDYGNKILEKNLYARGLLVLTAAMVRKEAVVMVEYRIVLHARPNEFKISREWEF